MVPYTATALATDRQERQIALRSNQDRLNAFMLLLGGSNYLRTQKLARQYTSLRRDLRNTETALVRLEDTVDHNAASIDTVEHGLQEVSEHVDTQARDLCALHDDVSARAKEVDAVLAEYRTQLAAQREALAEQEQSIQRLTGSKLKQDVLVDTAVVLMALFGASTPLVSLPVSLLARLAALLPGLNRNPSYWTTKLASLGRGAAALFLARTLRTYALRVGAHNHVGTPATYSKAAINIVRALTASRLAYAWSLVRRAVGAAAPSSHDVGLDGFGHRKCHGRAQSTRDAPYIPETV